MPSQSLSWNGFEANGLGHLVLLGNDGESGGNPIQTVTVMMDLMFKLRLAEPQHAGERLGFNAFLKETSHLVECEAEAF